MSVDTMQERFPLPGQRSGTGAPVRGLNRLLAHVLTALDVARQRRALLRLDDRMLKDIGISRYDAVREAERNFWDIPKDRMRG